MVVGTPRVDLAALLELKRVLIEAGRPENSPSDKGFVGRKAMKLCDLPTAIAGRQMNLLFDANRLDGLEESRTKQSRRGTGADTDAGRGRQGRGA